MKPTATTITAVSNTTSGVKITWLKVTGATGYYVYCSTSEDGTYTQIAKITGGLTVTYTNKSSGTNKVTSGKTYYVRIRSYKKVSGTKYYSAWSSKKRVKISK